MSRLKCLTVVFALTAAACGSSTAPTTTPAATTITDTYSGEIKPNNGQTWSFVTSQSGVITATITALAPDSTLVVGLALGTWNGTSCQVVLVNDKATLNSSLFGQASSSGNLCVRVSVGDVVESVTYEVQVTHF